MSLEKTIVANLIYNPEYATKVIPYTKGEYFETYSNIIKIILKFYGKYDVTPKKSEIMVEIDESKGLNDKEVETQKSLVSEISKDNATDIQWLLEKTERFYKQRAMANAIISGAELLEKKGDNYNNILDLVQSALEVNFDDSIGLDYFNDVQRRYDMYHTVEDKVSWGLRSLDNITGGGISKKTIACCVAPTGSGKSGLMCSIASNVIRNGQNVLYISLEMSEERVAERIDANLFGEPTFRIRNLPLNSYLKKATELKEKAYGKLIIREYPTSNASVNDFRALLKELKSKRGFVPDLVIVDYMNICCSSRLKQGQTNSYGYIKAISEELRGMAVEYNLACLTATQTNRNGFNNSDLEITDISESIGSTHVMDFIFALIRTEAMDTMKQLEIKQFKNRYADLNECPTVTLGVDLSKMKMYDLDSSQNPNNPSNYASSIPSSSETSIDAPWNSGAPKNDFSNFNF